MASKGKWSAKTTAKASNICLGDHNSLYFTSKTPHFYKVIEQDAIQHGKLKIPAQFVRKYGSGISSPIYLKVPSGALWQIELTKSNGETWLQSGWREFVEHYSLEFEDFVVFKYEGNSLFNVLIFDKSASEIEYPLVNNETGNLSFNGQSQGPSMAEDDDISVEILDDMLVPSSKKRKEISPLSCPRPIKKMRAYANNINGTKSNAKSHALDSKNKGANVSDNKINVFKKNGSSHGQNKGSSARGSIATKKKTGDKNACRHAMVKGKAKALQKASSFKSPHPFFTTLMHQSSITREYRLGIPWKFARQYLVQKHANVLFVVDGKTWSVEYSNTSNNFKPRFCNGWKQFSRDNKLNVGDVCVFELVDSTEIRFNVVIYHCEDSCQSLDENGASGVKSNKSVVTDHTSRSKGKQVGREKTSGSQDTQEASSLRTLGVIEASGGNFVPEDQNCKIFL